MNNSITFRKLTSEDCEQLYQWLQESHVREFWDDNDRTIEQVKVHFFNNSDTNRYVFLIDAEPAGLIVTGKYCNSAASR
ncbi:MAG: hypothetical protein ABI597_07990 [Gammaproteobacteria bacterium]